jgi:hypothetical protein
LIGRIAEILLPHDASGVESTGLLVVEKFEVGEALHFRLNMPVLRPPTAGRKEFIVIHSVVSCYLSVSQLCSLKWMPATPIYCERPA